MPIEFACEACSQLLRVPDGSQGQSCQCPACHQLLVIPDPAATSGVEAQSGGKAQSSREGQSRGDAQGDEKLKIACPACHFELFCSPSLLGTKGQCRNCQTIFTIGEKSSAAATAGGRSEPGLIFNCPKCDQLFEGRAEMEGRKGKCHACGAVFAIELKPAQAVGPGSSGQQAAKSIAHRQPVTAQKRPTATTAKPLGKPSARRTPPASIQFACVHCQGVMEVPGSTAGRTTECPYCHQLLTIPQRSTVQPSTSVTSGKYFAPHVETQPKMFPDAPSFGARERDFSGRGRSRTDLDLSGGLADSNPYVAPIPDPYLSISASDEWDQPARGKKIRGLSFGNAFELTFSALFPYCLVAAASFALVAGLSLGLVIAAGALAGSVVGTMELDPKSTVGMGVIYGLIGGAVIVAVCLVTAVICMTCNTALHVVRRKKITSQVLFGTGESYGGMLVVMFGWTGFNILRDRGIPWMAQSLADGGQAETAVTVALVAVGVLFLLQVLLMSLLAYVPYALLDGQGLPDAIATSSSIFFGNFLTVVAINVCGSLLYALVSVVTCGVGLLVFIGGLLYLNAAVYKLAIR